MTHVCIMPPMMLSPHTGVKRFYMFSWTAGEGGGVSLLVLLLVVLLLLLPLLLLLLSLVTGKNY